MENTDADLASFEGKYPKDLFNKSVSVNGQPIGRVVKETDDLIVVFGDSGDSRFDIPKSKVVVAGGTVIVNESLEQFLVDKGAPMPEGRGLRPSTEEIIQKASEVPEKPTAPAPEYKPSVAEVKAKVVASELKGAGNELGNAAEVTVEKLKDIGATAVVDLENAAKKAASGISDLAKSGARETKEKVVAAQSNAEAGLSGDNAIRIEKESQPAPDVEMSSYEGKYPRDLFNKSVILNNQPVGTVAKDAQDMVVVFSDSDSSIRFDIPKSEITMSGNSIVVNEDLLFRYRKRRDDPMPPDRPLRPSGEEIRAAAKQVEMEKRSKTTTPDAIIQERTYLSTSPRPETTSISMPEGYVDTESELSKKFKQALAELKEIIIAGTKVAKKKAKQAQRWAVEKQAELDAAAIGRMGDLSTRFADSFEEILTEIRTRTYADQEQIYTGFLKLMDTQRDLVVAQRDLARRLKDSVTTPVVEEPQLGEPPKLPENINENEVVKNKNTATRARRTRSSRKKP